MRLLHTAKLEIVNFTGTPPRYAILSHTWEDEEVILQDLQPGGKAKQMKGYAKIRDSCALAASQGYDYIWVDTCCIDKSSSAELSEAINSMFRWYREADVCYAFLSDVATTGSIEDFATTAGDCEADMREVAAARWFTRGWTLQELIAPRSLDFFNKDWVHLGSRDKATMTVGLATSIPPGALLGRYLPGISIHQRMQWAATRITSRPEDIAYCLLGIFDVNMPLLYGEGKKKAFRRLQEEIVKTSKDLSIFLWTLPGSQKNDPDRAFQGLLAEDPSWFTPDGFRLRDNESPTALQEPSMGITNKGVNVQWTILRIPNDPAGTIYLAMLARSGETSGGIVIQQLDKNASQFCRVVADRVIWVERQGGTYQIVGNDFLTDSRSLLGSSTSRPQNFYMRQEFEQFPSASLDALGFSFSEGEYQMIDGQKNRRICVEGSSCEFQVVESSGYRTWFAHVPQGREHFPTAKRVRQTKVLGALAVSFGRYGKSKFWNHYIPPHCIVIGVEILPQTALATANTFFVPWVVFTCGEDPQAAMESCRVSRQKSTSTPWRGNQFYVKCELKRLSRVSGSWFDIQLSTHENRR